MFRSVLFFGLTCLSAIACGQTPSVVQRITEVDFQVLLSNPPHLVITVKGLVPTGGFTDTKLLRAQYIQPPADGIQDYFLVSTPPAQTGAAVITEVTASDQIRRYTVEYPWLRGVRVHGVGTGVMTKMLSGNLRVRKNILSLTPAELTAFKTGVQVMKSRPVSDRRSWTFQANIHGENTPANDVLWNQCQHGSLHFLTWHRAYLLEFERILRDASGDQNFTLPYWDWTTARSLPAAFRDPASPLFDNTRSINGGQLLPTSVVVDDLATALNNLNFNGFNFGIEGSPHNPIHGLVGGRMGAVQTSALDPIFWLHHCNIDRGWDSWLSRGGGRANPVDPAFLNRTFTFANQSGATVTHRVGDLLSSSTLGYRYADLSGTAPAPTQPIAPEERVMLAMLEGAPENPPEVLTVASSRPAPAQNATESVEAAPAKPLGLSAERVELESRADGQARMRTAVESASEQATEQIFVDVVGLKVKEAPRFAYTVYLNLPNGQISDEVKKLYRVSTLSFFGLGEQSKDAGHAHGGPVDNRQRFDATLTVAKLREAGLWKEGKYVVTLEPLTPISTKADDPELSKLLKESAESSKITYERIDISLGSK